MFWRTITILNDSSPSVIVYCYKANWRIFMKKQPRCKKCGRQLKSFMSIVRGMGPKCAGGSVTSGKSVCARNKQSSGLSYQSLDLEQIQTPLFPGDLPAKRLSKKELYRRLQEERRRLFEMRMPFQCGMLLLKRKPLIYTPLDDGSWKENPSGRVISHERLQEYLKQYRFI
jgi:hypothetical protein